jgi:hypothetical protein
MHASIWHIHGDPDELIARYDAMLAEVPQGNLIIHLCLRGDDGIVIVDTCPTRDAYEEFRRSDWFTGLLARHGLDPVMEDHPVHVAFARGAAVPL